MGCADLELSQEERQNSVVSTPAAKPLAAAVTDPCFDQSKMALGSIT